MTEQACKPSPSWDPYSLLLLHLPLQTHSPSSLLPGRLTLALPRNPDLWFCLGHLWPVGGPRGGRACCAQGLRCFLYPWGSRCSPSRFSWSWQWKDSFVHSPTPVWLQLPFQGSVHCWIPLLCCPLLHQSESFFTSLLAVLSGPHHPLWVPLFYFFGHVTQHLGSWFSDQGSNPHPLHGKQGVATTGPSGKSLGSFMCTHTSIKSPSFKLSPGTPSLSSSCYNIIP